MNRFAQTPTEIPLNPAYVYYALPLDSSLKGLLTRWARDTKLGLNYGLASDYTLYGPVGQIRTSNQQAALQQLADAYAAQRIAITVQSGVITVRPAAN